MADATKSTRSRVAEGRGRTERPAATATLVVRAPEELAANADGLMGGWWALRTTGDVITILIAELDGYEGLLRRYESVDFLAPIHAGEFLRFAGEVVAVGRTSRTVEVVGERLSTRTPDASAQVLGEPETVFRARAIAVTPSDRQPEDGKARAGQTVSTK